MDIGYIQFEFETLTSFQTWNQDGFALIQFPTYYAANIGEDFKCTLSLVDGTSEDIYCSMAWDWTLKVLGPRETTVEKGTEFYIKVDGVHMNNPGDS